jgi:hypothetical protein
MIHLLLSVQSFFGEMAGGETWEQVWLPLTLAAVITVFIIYTTFLMFARAFNIRELEMYSKSEMLDTAATAFMAISLVMLVNGAIAMSATVLAIGAGAEMPEEGYVEEVEVVYICEEPMHININEEAGMDQMIDGIRCRIKEKASQIRDVQKNVAIGSEARDEFNLRNFDLSIIGITIFKGEWLPDTYKSTEMRRIVNNLATTLLVSLNAQIYLLSYIKANMIHIFLPMGILLRAFKFTRGVGALFISLAVGLYFIFPVVFTLLDPGFVGVVLPEPAELTPPTLYCYPTMSAASAVYSVSQQSAASVGAADLDMGDLKDALSEVYISLIIHPLISLFITLIAVRYMMSVLGGDAYALVKMVTKVI